MINDKSRSIIIEFTNSPIATLSYYHIITFIQFLPMKFIFMITLIWFIPLNSLAQDHDSVMQTLPSNSFANDYKTTHPSLKYSYTDSTQTHNYSNNWDFDGDVQKDSLYFIGTHGAHLYYYVSIVLSSNHQTYNFEFLEIDAPYLGAANMSKKSIIDADGLWRQFFVNDFTNDGLMDICLHLDEHHANFPKKWKRKGLTSNPILITYQKKHLALKNFR